MPSRRKEITALKRSTKVLLIILVVLIIDQTIKFLVKTNMYFGQEIKMLGLDWARIHFTENPGMAFGVEIGGQYGKLALSLFRMRLAVAGREKQLVEEKLQSELRFLRAQTNPHFLFNTLNNLYHLARKRSDSTPDAILKLSGMMRFMLYECSAPRIRLSQEVNVIRDYLDLERLRYGARLDVGFQVEADEESRLIAPLLLLPFVENAFKHGASESQGNTWVRIFLLLKNGELHFRVENAKDPSERMAAEGIGLKNVKRQLELLYPAHSLELDDEGDRFSARLRIGLYNETRQP